MVETNKTTYDFIKEAVPIRVGILANDDAETLCLKSNLSFSDLIKPFSKLPSQAQIQGPGSQLYQLYNLHIHAIDVKAAASESAASSHAGIAEQINDFSGDDKVSTTTIHVGDYELSVNRNCPWMELYRNFVLRSGPPQSHEFLSHLVACMLVVSSSNPNPIQAFSDISQQQNRIQHGDTANNLRWMTPNTMKFYVLIHDIKEGDIAKAKEAFSSLQLMFGQNYVYLLKINSRENSSNDSDTDMPSPWMQMRNMPKTTADCNGVGTGNVKRPTTLGCFLTTDDHGELRTFVQDFIQRALLPHLEKTIRNINEQLSTRKGLHKSIFKATKAIFGSSKSSSSISSGGYHTDSNELLVRKAADLCFLTQMYDQALHLYHGAKKDYTNDQAWLHAAGASEMAAVSNFMMRNLKQSYPIQYMEYAINSYLDICRQEHLALRCGLIHVECLQQVGMFQEAAFHLIRMTTEKDDLRSALLLEQAAYCYLKMQNPQPKKFAFEMILAAHRFSKCGQKSHAIRCYEMASQIYSDRPWQLIHDHLDYAVGRLHSSSKNYTNAMNCFRKLLVRKSTHPEAQQVSILREFGNVWHKCVALGNAEKFANLFLPQLALQETSVTIGRNNADISMSKHAIIPNLKIREVENAFIEQKMLSRSRFVGAIASLSKNTDNTNGQQISVGEMASIELTCVNRMGIAIILHDITMEFGVEYPDGIGEVNNGPSHKCDAIDHVTLEAHAKLTLKFTFEPLVTAKFIAKSMKYKLGSYLSGAPPMDELDRQLQVMDCQPLIIKGKRLNGSRQEKCGVIYGTDNRLNIHSFIGFPELQAAFHDFPSALICDEVKEMVLIVTNTGENPISTLEYAVIGGVSIKPKEADQLCGGAFYTLSNEVLDPGKTVKYNLILKGPELSGHYTVNMLVFCKSSELPSSYRSYLVQQELSCTDGFKVEIEMINAMTESDSIISACAEGVGRDTQAFSFKDMSLSTTSKVYPIGQADAVAVPISTKLYRYFKQESQDVVSGKGSNQPHEALVEWSYRNTNNSDQVNGQQTVAVKCADSVSNDSHGNSLSNAETLKYLHHTVSWRLSTDRIYHHGFSSGQFCVIDCKLIAVNTSKFKLSVFISAIEPSAGTNHAAFSWVGLSKVNRTIEPNSKSTVVLKACFTKPGIYSLGGIVVSAAPVDLVLDAPIPQKPLSSYFVTINDIKSTTD